MQGGSNDYLALSFGIRKSVQNYFFLICLN